MRLIDADKLLARIRLNYNNHQNITAGAMTDLINTTKTAYSVDAVVAELEEYKKWYETHGCNANLNRGIIGATNHAIDIVKRGGIE